MKFYCRKKSSSAQGTIEYLVILAVVVVISLVIVGLFTNVFSSPSQQINESSDKFSVVSGGISVVESVIDVQGDSLIKLSNNSSDSITLTKISLGGVDNNFSEQLVGLDSKVFSLSSLNSSCPCEEGQEKVKCEFRIEYTTVSGISKTEYRTISAQCVSDSVPVDLDVVVEPIVEITNCFDALDDPIPICTLSDLNRVREDLSASYILMNDIDASETISWNNGAGFEPIGHGGAFSGEFNGSNYTISELYINRAEPDTYHTALFVDAGNADFRNIILSGVDIRGYEYVGALVSAAHDSAITNVSVSGTITGNQVTGGIIGWANSGTTITNSHNEAIVLGEDYTGGIAGETASATLSSVYNSGEIQATDIENSLSIYGVGGIAGYSNSSVITQAYNSGLISGINYVGGIVGSIENNTLVNSVYNSGDVTASLMSTGGIVGNDYGSDSNVTNVYNSGTIFGLDIVGGVIGTAGSGLTNAYNVGSVSGRDYVGGVIGSLSVNTSSSNIFNVGPSASGLVGWTGEFADVNEYAYWDSYLTGASFCYHDYGYADSNVGCVETNNQASLYYGASGIPFANLNWSTDIWAARENNYPILSWQ